MIKKIIKNKEEIKNVFVIKDKESGVVARELPDIPGYLCFATYPVVFSSKEDVERYLKMCGVSEEEKNSINIEYIEGDIHFDKCILIEF